MNSFLTSLRARISQIFDGLEARGSKRPKALRSHAAKLFGPEHPDIAENNLFPIPLIIIGTKYDMFFSIESYLQF